MKIDFLNEKQTAHLLGCSVYKLQRDRIKGTGLRFVKIGRSVKYQLADIEAYIASRVFTSTSEYGGK